MITFKFNYIRVTWPAARFRYVYRPVAPADVRADRAADHADLINTKRYGRRSFRIFALAVWNKLPLHLRTEDTLVVNNSHKG